MALSDIPDMDWGRISQAVLWVEQHLRHTNQILPTDGSPVPFQFRRFRLAEALNEGSSAEAVHRRWDGDASFQDGETFTVWDLVDNYVGKVGDEGWAIHPHDLDRWEIVELRQSEFIHLELKGALSPGGSAPAHPRLWNGAAYVTDTDTEFEVFDVLGQFRGRGIDDFGSPHNEGSFGTAVRGLTVARWEIEDLQPTALMLHGQLTGDVETTDSTFTIDGVEIMQPVGAIITDTEPGDPITVNNLFSFEGDDGGQCIIVWNEDDADWDALQMECKA